MYSRLKFVGNTSKKLPLDLLSNSDMAMAIFCLQLFSLISKADDVIKLSLDYLPNYSPNFIDSCSKQFLNKLYTSKVIVQNVPKTDVLVKLPFFRTTSIQIQKKLQQLFTYKLIFCNLKIVFMSPVRVKS